MNLIITLILLLFPINQTEARRQEPLKEAEKEGILLMREEEKLAHDVYLHFTEQWNIPVFNNIRNSETRHFEAVGFLLEEFELNDPTYKKTGKFRNQELALLYDSLTNKNSRSLVGALKAGALVEEIDIQDLQRLISETNNETIISIYQNLLRASENHIRAFTQQLSFQGIEYVPQILSEDEYKSLINTPHQPGNSMGNMMQPPNNFNGKGRMRHGGKIY